MSVMRKNCPELLEVVDLKNNRKLAGQERDLFFFLLSLFILPTSVGNTMKHYGANVFKDYKITETLLDFFIELADKSRQFTEEQQEDYFQTNLEHNTIITLSLYSEKITTEKALLLLVDNFLLYYEDLTQAFRIREIRDGVEKPEMEKLELKTLTNNIPNFQLDQKLKNVLPKSSNDENISKGLLVGRELTKRKMLEDPLIGREKELRIFGSRLLDDKKSVILYGKPGVGKTAMVEGLAYRIQTGIINHLLGDKRIFEMSATEMVAETKYRGELEKKMLDLINELSAIPNAILFIDEIHMIIGGGRSLGDTIDLSNILKPYVGNGKLKIIGATTDEEYKIIKSDGALMRRFNGLYIPELTSKEVVAILNHEINHFKKIYGIDFAFVEDKKECLLQLLISLADKKYQDDTLTYNPDFALTMLNNGYDLARYDGVDNLSVDTLIEGIEIADQVNQEGKDYFKDEVLKLVRNK